jgi:formyl-CoA transferase
MKHRAECNAMAAKWCVGLTVDEVVAVCAREGIACAPVNTYTQAAQDPHVRERDMLQETIQEDGSRALITGPAAKFAHTGADTSRIARPGGA